MIWDFVSIFTLRTPDLKAVTVLSLEACPRDQGGTEHPLHPHRSPYHFLHTPSAPRMSTSLQPPKFRLPLGFIGFWFRFLGFWKGRMVCVTETWLGAAHPQEKLEHPQVCVKCRSSGDSWKIWMDLSVSLLIQENQLKKSFQSSRCILHCIQKVIKFLIKLSASYKLDSGFRYVPRGQNCNSGLGK